MKIGTHNVKNIKKCEEKIIIEINKQEIEMR